VSGTIYDLPKANEKDQEDVPQEVRDELTFIPVERIEEVRPGPSIRTFLQLHGQSGMNH